MTRIGKILVVVFIFLGVFAFPVSAQQMSKAALQRMYMDYLREEGYMPSIDEDGDILFKVAGDSYYIIIDEDDLQFFQIYGFKFGFGSIANRSEGGKLFGQAFQSCKGIYFHRRKNRCC